MGGRGDWRWSQALKAARSRGLKVSLLLVPRHAERRDAIAAALAKTGLRHHLRSHGAAPHEVDIAVGDTTGELRDLTQLADLVFCGKSLPPHDGGQSPVEAASLGKPLLFGPHMTNFREIARRACANAARAREVLNESELVAACVELLADEPQRARAWAPRRSRGTRRTAARSSARSRSSASSWRRAAEPAAAPRGLGFERPGGGFQRRLLARHGMVAYEIHVAR